MLSLLTVTTIRHSWW